MLTLMDVHWQSFVLWNLYCENMQFFPWHFHSLFHRTWQESRGRCLRRHVWNVPEGLGVFTLGKQIACIISFVKNTFWWRHSSALLFVMQTFAVHSVRPGQVWPLMVWHDGFIDIVFSALLTGWAWRELQGGWGSGCPRCKGEDFRVVHSSFLPNKSTCSFFVV